jgi:hypothetical protein
VHGQREDLLGSERGPWRLIGCHLRMAAVARVVVDQLRLAGHRIDARGVQAFGELVRVQPGLWSHLNGVLMPVMEPVDRSAGGTSPRSPARPADSRAALRLRSAWMAGSLSGCTQAIAACRSVSR